MGRIPIWGRVTKVGVAETLSKLKNPWTRSTILLYEQIPRRYEQYLSLIHIWNGFGNIMNRWKEYFQGLVGGKEINKDEHKVNINEEDDREDGEVAEEEKKRCMN